MPLFSEVSPFLNYINNCPILYTASVINQATEHCQRTTSQAHLIPISRLIDATAAIQGVYSNENTRSDAADRGDIALFTC